MKLADLLSEVGTPELERLAHEYARVDDPLSRPQMLETIEGVLRSYRFLQEFISNRQPPTFAMLTLLLEAPGYALPTGAFRDSALTETDRIARLFDAGEILQRDGQLRLYRRVLYEARRNDLQIDPSESAILGVLRQELHITQVEHFLLEHHGDLREFWKMIDALPRELNALYAAGLLFERNGQTMLPEDIAPIVRQVLGIEMPRENAGRLFSYLTGQELYDALSAHEAPTSGSKEERVERLLTHMIQPRGVLRLRGVGLETLRDICRRTGAAVSGSKDELVDRLVEYFSAGRDLESEPQPEEPIREDRRLDETRFKLLFSRLKGHELEDILRTLDLRHSGSKSTRIQTLWDARRAEETLLSVLLNRNLDEILDRIGLPRFGSKTERIERLLTHFATLDEEAILAAQSAVSASELPSDDSATG